MFINSSGTTNDEESSNYNTLHNESSDSTQDPLTPLTTFDNENEDDVDSGMEQIHNILKPYYRTIDEPWNKSTEDDPRVTLAAMFKRNSAMFQADSNSESCSRTDCQNKRFSFWEREWEQRRGRGLYYYTKCIKD